MTQEQFNRLLANATKSVQVRNLGLVIPERAVVAAAPVLPPPTDNPAEIQRAVTNGYQPCMDEQQLNKTEAAYLAWLRTLGCWWIGVQCVTLKMSFNQTYTADFWALDDQGVRAIDTKGTKTVEGKATYYCPPKNKNKIKVAARLYPWIRFLIAYQHPHGVWNHVVVKP